MSAVLDTYTPPEHGWTCFHCGDTFMDAVRARDHFGGTIDATPGCMLKLEKGDRQLLRVIRGLEAQRDQLLHEKCAEDSELHRALHAKSAEMHTAVRRAEEQGYDRGLQDAKKHPETLGLQLAQCEYSDSGSHECKHCDAGCSGLGEGEVQ